MILNIVLFAVGLGLLLGGGVALVPGTVSLARKAGIPARLIAAVIIAGATSAPELLVAVDAALGGNPDIAWGNILGSNIANILLVLGLGLLVMPVMLGSAADKKDMLFLTVITVIVILIVLGGGFDARWSEIWPYRFMPMLTGAALIISMVIYMRVFAHSGPSEEEDTDGPDNLVVALLLLFGGLAALIFGADLMVDAAVSIAIDFGISQAVIGVTIVAIGTSLPEITAVAASLMSRRTDIALGNVIGSNLFNLCIVLGATAIIAPLPAGAEFTGNILIFFAATCFLLTTMSLRAITAGRVVGLLFMAGYCGFLFTQFP